MGISWFGFVSEEAFVWQITLFNNWTQKLVLSVKIFHPNLAMNAWFREEFFLGISSLAYLVYKWYPMQWVACQKNCWCIASMVCAIEVGSREEEQTYEGKVSRLLWVRVHLPTLERKHASQCWIRFSVFLQKVIVICFCWSERAKVDTQIPSKEELGSC